MKIYFRIFGWLLIIPSAAIYIILWIKAFKFISDKIGSFFTFILLFLTNVIGPGVYVIWHWIDAGFPTRYFLLWIGASVIFIVGRIIKALASDE